MPTAAESPARSRVIDVVRVIEGTGLDVAHAGDKCALIVYTRAGIVRVLMPTHVFVEKARGAADCNGNPFPKASVGRKEAIERELAADATPPAEEFARSAPVAPPRVDDDGVVPFERSSRIRPKGKVFVKCEQAFAALEAMPALTIQEAAAAHDLKMTTLSGWISNHRRMEWRAIQTQRKAQS